MPSVIDAPEVVEYDKHALDERHDLSQEQPQGRVARAGFWRTVVQSMRWWLWLWGDAATHNFLYWYR